MLNTSDKKVYDMQHDNKIHLLTNDSLKKCEFILEDNNGASITIDAGDSLEIMIKIEYLDQEKATENYLNEVPKLL